MSHYVCKAVRVSEAVEPAQDGIDTPESIRRHFGFDDDDCCGRRAEHADSIAALARIKLKRAEPVPANAVGVAA